MAPPLSDASPIRVALIDDDSGLLTVLERRLGALRWELELLAFPPDASHLAAPSQGTLALLAVVPDATLREPATARLTEMAEQVKSGGLRVTTAVTVGDAAPSSLRRPARTASMPSCSSATAPLG